MTILVDFDILLEVARGRNRQIVSQWLELSNSKAAVLYSPVTAAELWAGAYLRQYRRSHGVEMADALIASSAVANHAQLWTRNRQRYPMPELSFF